jgi:hypothetical protein
MQPELLGVYDISRLASHVHSDGISGLEVETQDHAATINHWNGLNQA